MPDQSGSQLSEPAAVGPVDLAADYRESGVAEILDELDQELVGLRPVKQRIRETAALLIVENARKRLGLAHQAPTLHMSFTGNPGVGKTTVALKMAGLLRRLGYVRNGHLVSVTRDDLVGQYIGHTAPKTRGVLKKAMGGVLFIDEAYYLYRPDNERDYGQEAIEILLQVMENNRDDLVVILAGYADRMDRFFTSNPGFRSRIAHHIEFPDYSDNELLHISENMLKAQGYRFTPAAQAVMRDYIATRRSQPHFAMRARSATHSTALGCVRPIVCLKRPKLPGRSAPKPYRPSKFRTSAQAECLRADLCTRRQRDHEFASDCVTPKPATRF